MGSGWKTLPGLEMDHVDRERFATIFHIFPAMYFFEAVLNWRRPLDVTVSPKRVEPTQSNLRMDSNIRFTPFLNLRGCSPNVSFDSVGFDRFAKESMTHPQIDHIHGKDFVHFFQGLCQKARVC
jgi:hypothetical protein